MSLEIFGGFLTAALAATVLTAFVRSRSIRAGTMDVPNERSSHVVPTPRGGGIAIVIVSLTCIGILGASGRIALPLCWALLGGGASIALVGYLDDRGRIGIAGRFVVHVAAAIWAVAWLGGFTELQHAGRSIHLGFWGTGLAVVGTVWALNLFNFMDGIDGIAASQSAFMGGAGAVVAIAAGLSPSSAHAGLAICAASLGFLVWNWPPAKIFMGDVGSGFLGFALAVVALAAAREEATMLSCWLSLGGLFAVDATATLLRRLLRGEPVYQAHRLHAYQWQSRRWKSHLRVTGVCIAINVCWVFPWAWIGAVRPGMALWSVVCVWLPLIVLALACGAGRPETMPSASH